jgi:maleylpyruvate isomerase
MTVTAPLDVIAHVGDAQRRFLEAVGDLDDATARRASLLPSWTVGHVMAHVARNADSHVRRCEAAARGEIVEQYPGGYAGRAAEIDSTAARPAVDLIADVRSSAARLDHTWTSLADEAWTMVSIDVGGRERPLSALPSRRWQELEVHAVDLGLDVTHRDWADDFVRAFLPQVRGSLSSRLPEGAGAPALGTLDERDELAWLYGRLRRDDLPTLAPWG